MGNNIRLIFIIRIPTVIHYMNVKSNVLLTLLPEKSFGRNFLFKIIY